ncbi:Transmembrane protease serine 9 [Cichlidogyrus casuarinus]|uniref:Transmembrane protease serine 9 n=1 Tax=Cichlidogyrus casuarinus TaxID=1844966 RepID=A0ABD2Q9M7_9PLAT
MTSTLKNDIGLIKLERPVNLKEYPHIKLAELATNEKFPKAGDVCKMAGWGLKRDGKVAPDAQFLQTNAVDSTLCSKTDENFNVKEQFCEQPRSGNKTTAGGDSGSGILCSCDRGRTWSLAGLVSYGDAAEDFLPSVNVRVSAYHDWIDDTMTNEKPVTTRVDPEDDDMDHDLADYEDDTTVNNADWYYNWDNTPADTNS